MSYLGQEIKQILPGNVAVGGANMGMVPLFAVMWCPNRSAIWAGYVPADGQELLKSLYPDADAGIQANNVPLVAEATWQSTPTERAKYVATSSAGKFRVADLNGVSGGALGAVFLRGDGAKSAGTDGVIQPSAFEDHGHPLLMGSSTAALLTASNGILGGITASSGGDVVADNRYDFLAQDGKQFVGNASLIPANSTDVDDTRPLNATGCWVIKMFGAVTNAGAADAAQLATAYAQLASEKVNLASFVGTNQSLTTNGWQKLPGGLIMQWGLASMINGTVVVTLPIAFPSVHLMSTGHETTATASQTAVVKANTLTLTTLEIAANAIGSFTWLSFGY